ncbi:phytanoyl-CoA dioxygenase family protein [Candidatus Poribacteria bacterium]|nr:phytanoyl-CoA dioxygenase family protein [Candidatus Poribacteria bacterium]
MTPKQRYLFDLTGYIHLKNVLSEVELKNAQDAVERCVQTPVDELPPGISYGGGGFSNGFSYDKSLEALTLHPKTWPIVQELTSNRPRFNRGSLVAKGPEHDQVIGKLHCAREDCGWQTRRYVAKNGKIHNNDFAIFFYFTDVYPGDGGLVVLPGSHKAGFERPEGIFFPDPENPSDELHPALVNVTARAGDAIVMSELLTHGVLIWKPKERYRRFLILRYKTQFFEDNRGRRDPFPPEVMERLSPETRELAQPAHYTHIKDIVKQEHVQLT